jgi:hypothetical protein
MRFDLLYLGIAWIDVTMTDSGPNLTVRAKSTPKADGWAFTDNTYTIGYSDDYLPDRYTKSIHQKKYREESTTRYDRNDLTARYQDRLVSGLPRVYAIDGKCRDFFSALYHLRNSHEKKEITLDVNGFKWSARIEPKGVETITTLFGKTECDHVRISFRKLSSGEPESSDMLTNNLVNEKTALDFWFTRDSRHIPIRCEYKLFPFSVVWKLKEYTP